jgi:apolipoprotein N-acyltransferase
LAGAVIAVWLGYGAVRLGQVRDATPAGVVRLALVQPDITAEDKKHKDAESRKALFARLSEMTSSADLARVDAVVWPEGAFSFYFALDSGGRKGWENVVETSRRLVEFVRGIGKPLVFGTLTKPADRARNSVVMLGPDGAEVGRYDKRKLLAFGEYMPFSDVFTGLKKAVREVSDMEAGTRPVALPIGGAKALVSICYEAILPTFTRSALEETGADLVLNFTNDAWFGESGAPAQHLMVQVPRAVELRVPLVRQTETGISAIVTAAGDFVYETGVHERRVDVVDVAYGADVSSPYRAVGDLFAWLCAAGALAAIGVPSFVRYRSGKKSRSARMG